MAATARPATRTIVSTPLCSPTRCAPIGSGCGALIPDTDATIALRRACRARKDLINHRVAVANRLRAHLRNVLPAAVGLFKDIDSTISLAFLTRFDTQDKIDWLTPKRLGDWLINQGYSGRTDPAVLHQHLVDAAPEPPAPTRPPRPRSPPRGPYPRPSMAAHHPALLARQPSLRSRQAPRTPTIPPSKRGGLT